MSNCYTVGGVRLFNTTGKKKMYNGGVMLTLGDSYTAMMSSYFDRFASDHGLVQHNVGLASSTISGSADGSTVGYHAFWVRLDEAIASYPKTINGNSYTLEDVKLITFMGGANDWSTVDASIDRIGDRYSTNKEQLYGACKYIFSRLQTVFPNADIVVILQPNNKKDSGTDPCIMQLKESVVEECANMYGLAICDCFKTFPSPYNDTMASKYYQSDKLHLTDEGWDMIIDRLEQIVDSL